MSGRPPTPIGWSDTDWIKKLQDDEENPLACLHINQGSFDAAADAYEEEYKMSKRTALETSDDWRNDPIKVANCYNTPKYAAILLRRQHAEIERLKADADRVNSCAKNLAIAMHRKNFSNITQWEPLPDTMGLISQIDNMSCWHDAEIERLKTVPMKYRRMAFNAQLQEEIKQLTAERDAAIANASALTHHLTQVIGEHYAPSDCYSSGPLLGDARDVVCPACEALRFLNNPREVGLMKKGI